MPYLDCLRAWKTVAVLLAQPAWYHSYFLALLERSSTSPVQEVVGAAGVAREVFLLVVWASAATAVPVVVCVLFVSVVVSVDIEA